MYIKTTPQQRLPAYFTNQILFNCLSIPLVPFDIKIDFLTHKKKKKKNGLTGGGGVTVIDYFLAFTHWPPFLFCSHPVQAFSYKSLSIFDNLHWKLLNDPLKFNSN